MRRFIKVEPELRDKISAEYHVSRMQVWRALNFLRNSDQAKDIRQFALAAGGQYVQENFVPNCQTEHTGEAVIQTFPCGVVVKVSKIDSSAELLVDDQLKENYTDITISSWGNLLAHAQELSLSRVNSL